MFSSREGRERVLVLTAAALTIFVLYAPQPLLPMFAELYGLSESEAGLLMTVTMIPLAIAPLTYGYLLKYVRSIQLLRVSLLLLAGMTVLTGLTTSFSQMLAIRFLHGLLIPAALTAVMAYLAQPGRGGGTLQQGMSLYVAATICGGFLGRFLAGVSSSLTGWRFFYFLVGGMMLLGSLVIRSGSVRLKEGKKYRGSTDILGVLRSCLFVYLAVFLLFYVFCGILNYLPFRIIELSGIRSGVLTGIMYGGYISGIVTSLSAGKIIRQARSESRVMISSYCLFLLMLAAMLFPQTAALFVLLFPFCGAMFLVHTVATAVVNSRTKDNQGQASGIYVSSYYGGGILGTYFPGFIYQTWGWMPMIASLLLAGGAGVVLLVLFFRKRK